MQSALRRCYRIPGYLPLKDDKVGDTVIEYRVHQRLKNAWSVSEAHKHEKELKMGIFGIKGHLLHVTRGDYDLMKPLSLAN